MKVIACFSGGLDSTVLLWHLRVTGHEVVGALSVNYGQRHVRELQAASEIASIAKIEHRIIDLSDIQQLLKGSSQTDDSIRVPEGHYAEESMRLTVVPNRNAIILSLATAWAISSNCDAIAYAAHSGDHFIYYDCRPTFLSTFNELILLTEPNPITLLCPFRDWNKSTIVQRGWDLRVPLHLSYTCYNGRKEHCGRCGSCNERKEAFTLAKVEDPTRYE